ncbi:MAG TPA: DEAD/DEAH box helicase [Candidatus Saccharimonadales bacterium]|jgi:superfamily II DNA/RNA helicase|nr:DEAD/DEAH box helicase [Candidatus Saccharimonadales bacterium]
MPYSYQSRRQSSGGGNSRSAYHAAPNKRRGRGPKHGDYIDPARFVQAARPRTEMAYIPTYQFADFKIDQLIKRNIEFRGLVTPTPIQDQTIPLGLEGKDIVGIANTGTGKTIAFAIPVLEHLLADPRAKALIMAPTRELAQQIMEEMRTLTKGAKLWSALLIGGNAMGPQLRDLRNNPRLIVGTPGRIKDHIDRRTINMLHFNTVVLDEVDRMLDMGFINDMREILQQMGSPRQSFFFSATMNASVNNLIGTFANNPVTVSVKTGESSDNVEQDVITYGSKEDKMAKLHDTLSSPAVTKVLVFEETQRNVERLHRDLESRGFRAAALHGGMTQGQRRRSMNDFKTNGVTILVATDVAARGIDVSDISHVINYAIPGSYEDYVHRIGRAGRAGRLGYALTFVEN